MSKCQCCGYSGKARVEYLELLRPMHQRIANQRKEITRLLAIESAWLAEGMAKAETQLAAERAAKETSSAPCCDINASYPGKHRGGCPQETGESPEAQQKRNSEWDSQREQIAPGKIPPGPKDPRPAGCTCGDWKNPRCLIHSTSKNRGVNDGR